MFGLIRVEMKSLFVQVFRVSKKRRISNPIFLSSGITDHSTYSTSSNPLADLLDLRVDVGLELEKYKKSLKKTASAYFKRLSL